jgi:predicted Zn-dependent peptidase
MNTIRVTTLPNGLRVATDTMPHVETASLGVWVGVGTRNERAEVNGVAHLVEHMVFKGTPSRTAFDISEQIEAVGGHMNAYTTRLLRQGPEGRRSPGARRDRRYAPAQLAGR